MSEVYKLINIPDFHKQRIGVATIEQFSNADKEQIKVLEKTLSNIYLYSVLDKDTMHIRPLFNDDYSYQTIYVIRATIKTDNNLAEVSRIMHSAFAEPVMIFFQLKDKEYLSLAAKRRNKIETSKTIIEEFILEEISDMDICYLDFKTISAENLKQFYEKVYNILYKVRFRKITGIYAQKEIPNLKQLIDEYESSQTGLNRLKQKYSEATMMSEQMKIDNEMYIEEQKQKEIVNQLKGGM